MKYTRVLFLLFIFATVTGCKKKYHFKTSEITVTDINGNITGNINHNDWQIKKFSDASDFDKAVFQKYQEVQNTGQPPIFKFSDYKSHCDLPNNFSLTAYPNPMVGSDCWLYFKSHTDLVYNYGIEIITKKNGDIIQSSGFLIDEPNDSTWRAKINALTIRDFIYYGIFVTPDSCLYYTRGNVIGCDL